MEKEPLLKNEEALQCLCRLFYSPTAAIPMEDAMLIGVACGIACGIIAATPKRVYTTTELVETLRNYIPERYLGMVNRLL
jgi:hypothetical protein